MKRHTFHQLFRFDDIDTIVALRRIKVGMITLNKGAKVERGVVLAGIDFFDYVHATYECNEIDNKTLAIKKIFLHVA